MDGRVARFVNAIPWWAIYALSLVGIIIVGIQGLISPDRFAMTMLIAIAIGWTLLAAFWARLAKSTIKHNQEMIDEIDHLIDYITRMNETVAESLKSLSTYDRDKAMELAEEMNAFTAKALYDSYWREGASDKYE